MELKDENIDLELHEFGNKARDTVGLSLSVAILNQDIFSLDITEISQPLSKCIDLRFRIGHPPDRTPIRGSSSAAAPQRKKDKEQGAD